MAKASAHMEDSLIASYVALLIGCLVGPDEAVAEAIKAHMPGGHLGPITEQLGRFLEFMKVTVLFLYRFGFFFQNILFKTLI
jgi:hypothetical protein